MARKTMPGYSDYGLLVSLFALIFFIYSTAFGKIPTHWGFTFILFFGIYVISILISIFPNKE